MRRAPVSAHVRTQIIEIAFSTRQDNEQHTRTETSHDLLQLFAGTQPQNKNPMTVRHSFNYIQAQQLLQTFGIETEAHRRGSVGN